VVGELGNGCDLAVEVLLKGLLEGSHDANELVTREIGGALEAAEVLLELDQTGEEGLYGWQITSVGSRKTKLGRPQPLTMLLVCFLEHGLVVQQLLDLGEERGLLVVMVRFDELEPGEAVPDEISLVLVLNDGGLVVDGVVAAEDRVV
jgi:hypothetical protein